MKIDPTSIGQLPLSRGEGSAKVGGFEDVFRSMFKDANTLQSQAESQIEALATGKPVDPAMVASAINKADLAVKTIVQIRNKLVQAFDELRQLQI